MMSGFRKWGLLWLVLLSQAALASEALWLSDLPPGGGGGGRPAHSHGASGGRGSTKGLWLRAGTDMARAGYVTPEGEMDAMLFEPGRQLSWFVPEAGERGMKASFPAPDEGFYNVYLANRRVVDGRLEVSLAKAEVLNHSCRNGHDDLERKMRVKSLADLPLEIVRERMPKENLHGRVGFGDQVAFRVLAQGEPAAGVEVTFHTGSGWRRSAVTDQEGLVRFTVIRDYFPAWSDFDSYHRQDYLVTADMVSDRSGTWNGVRYSRVHYTATLPGSYFPSSRDYTSYAYGLVIGLFALTFSGLAVYLYRRRRARPLREVHFDE